VTKQWISRYRNHVGAGLYYVGAGAKIKPAVAGFIWLVVKCVKIVLPPASQGQYVVIVLKA